MTYEQIVSKVKAKYADADASSLSGTVAIQINLTGKNVEGIFYIEAKDGKVNVEDFPLLMHVDDIQSYRNRSTYQSLKDTRR